MTTAGASAAGPDAKYNAPRNEHGRPHLQGVWNFSSDVPLERPASAADKNVWTREELEYEATIVDPKTFQDKIVITLPMAKSDARIYGYACHEGNYSLPMILGGARKAEQDALKAKQ